MEMSFYRKIIWKYRHSFFFVKTWWDFQITVNRPLKSLPTKIRRNNSFSREERRRVLSFFRKDELFFASWVLRSLTVRSITSYDLHEWVPWCFWVVSTWVLAEASSHSVRSAPTTRSLHSELQDFFLIFLDFHYFPLLFKIVYFCAPHGRINSQA